MLYEILFFLIIGLLAGALGALFGIGGGFVFIPAQLFIYSHLRVLPELQIKYAIATSLAAVVFNSTASSYVYYRKKLVCLPVIKKIIPGIILGAALGAIIANIFPSRYLVIFFGCFECVFGVYFISSRKIPDQPSPKLFNPLIVNVIAFLISVLSVILGIGGGIFIIPLLTFLHLPLKQAIGSSSLATLIISLVGSLAMTFSALGDSLSVDAIGYIYLPALIPLSIGAALGSPVGAKLTQIIPSHTLKKVFGIFLIILGLIVLFRN